MLENSAEHFKKNKRTILRKSYWFDALSVLTVIELILLSVWSATGLS